MNFDRSNFSRASRLRSARAFTLVEMVLAAGIASLVMAGLFSATMIAARVAPSPYKSSALNLHNLFDRIRDDAAVASAVPSLTSTAITLTLPDRDGDGQPDTVVYDWSAATATTASITRTYNGVAEVIPVVAPSFSVTTTIDSSTNTSPVESSEQLLFTRTPFVPFAYSIRWNQWTGQYIVPSLPSNATAWRITRVSVPARFKGPAIGSTRVQIRTHSGGLPKTVVDEATMAESSLSVAYSKQTFTFSNAGNLALDGACLVLQWSSDADACEVEYESLLGVLAAGNRVVSTNAGLSWSAQTLQCLACDVYGTYTTPGSTTTIRKLRAINIAVKNDAALAGTLTTTIRFTNLPQVSP